MNMSMSITSMSVIKMDISLLGSYTRFSCFLIKTFSGLKNDSPLHSPYQSFVLLSNQDMSTVVSMSLE